MCVIISGVLALNMTLSGVMHTRVSYSFGMTPAIKPTACLIGVPHGYTHLIGKMMHFYPKGGGKFGPFLVVDVEARQHQGQMKERDLAADVNCVPFVHRRGDLVWCSKPH